MFSNLIQIAFIGPGGPELLVVMLVLLLMFGSKDAPRVFRKLNEMLNQVRDTANGFKREIMYGDLNPKSKSDAFFDEDECNEDYVEDEERFFSVETFHDLDDADVEDVAVPEVSDDENGDVSKT